MSFFSAKKLFLFGIILMLLVGIPLGVYLVQQEQETRSRAEKSTVTSFTPDSNPTSPILIGVGEEFTIDMMVNPGINLVSFVRFEITFDSELLALAETDGFTPNKDAFPITMDGPVLAPGKISGTLSVGGDPTQAIQATTRIGTITFKALKATGSTPTSVVYALPQTQILSTGATDQASEDVLSTTSPAYITITDSGGITPTVSPSVSPSITPSLAPTATITVAPTPTVTAPTPTVPGVGGPNALPLCTGFISNAGTTGAEPFATTFTATVSDPDGVPNKVTFNFGDGQVTDVALNSQDFATASAMTASAPHTYSTAGVYSATAVVTDNLGGISVQGACAQDITVNGTATPSASVPTLEPTGPGNSILSIGAVLGVLTFIGGLLFFAL